MTILMLLDKEFPPDIRVENEAISLIQHGHTIHLLSYNHSNKNKYDLYKGIHIHRFKINQQIAKKSLGFIHNLPFYKLIWHRQITKFLKKYSTDAIHIHDLPLCILADALKKIGIRVIADMHENYPYLVAEQPYMNTTIGKVIFSKRKWFIKEKQWLGAVDHIVCVAEEMKIRLHNATGLKQNITVVPNTYSFHSFDADQSNNQKIKKIHEGKFVISYIGGFDVVRGIQYLIRATAIVKNRIPEIELLLVGDGGIIEDLKLLVKTELLDNLVFFEGWQPASNVKAYIEASSICVIPHVRSEQTDNSSPNKLFQYMYCKKPVISSNCTSLEKIITMEKCGLVFKDKSSEDLAEKILNLYNAPDQCIRFGINGYNAVMEKYNWDLTVLPLLKIYS